jgi:hypothetical protein
MYATIARLDSVRLITLMMIITVAQRSEETTTSTGPSSSGIRPGRRMTSMPAKPAKIAPQRWMRNRSPRKTTLRMPAKTGAEKASAVARATSTIESA